MQRRAGFITCVDIDDRQGSLSVQIGFDISAWYGGHGLDGGAHAIDINGRLKAGFGDAFFVIVLSIGKSINVIHRQNHRIGRRVK